MDGLVKVDEGPVVHHFYGGVYMRELQLAKKGYIALGHQHTYDHMSILVRGAVTVRAHDVVSTYYAPCVVQIPAGVNHDIQALSDEVLWFCVHKIPDEFAGDIDAVLVKEA